MPSSTLSTFFLLAETLNDVQPLLGREGGRSMAGERTDLIVTVVRIARYFGCGGGCL
jgi:hypothetical protein